MLIPGADGKSVLHRRCRDPHVVGGNRATLGSELLEYLGVELGRGSIRRHVADTRSVEKRLKIRRVLLFPAATFEAGKQFAVNRRAHDDLLGFAQACDNA